MSITNSPCSNNIFGLHDFINHNSINIDPINPDSINYDPTDNIIHIMDLMIHACCLSASIDSNYLNHNKLWKKIYLSDPNDNEG